MLHLRTPTELRLDGYEPHRSLLEKELQYVDKKVEWELKKFKAGERWFLKGKVAVGLKSGLSQEQAEVAATQAFTARVEDLQRRRQRSMLFEDRAGLWTYSGVATLMSELLDSEVTRAYPLPEPRSVPWSKVPTKSARYYQDRALEALLAEPINGPRAVEMGTGLGKTFILQMLLKRLGLKSLVMAPLRNIAEQIYELLVEHFGKAKVGFYGDGKKESHKLFTVGIGASLTKIEPGSEAWDDLSQAQVFIADESHMCPAETLAKVCFGLVAAAPYRFFFSGTQIRTDGLDLLLDGITGPIVYRMTVQEGVDQGFLAKPVFRMCWIDSQMPCSSGDANELTRAHVYYNKDLNRKVAEIINKAVSVMGRPTLVLVEELPQIAELAPHLRYEAKFAHAGVTKENKERVPPQFHSSKPKELVEAFNKGEFPILVGTSCIATGTDILANQATVYLRGGMSEVEVRQGAAGRSTRLSPGKKDCVVFDVGVQNVDTLRRHAHARKKIYRDIYPSFSEIRI